MSATGAPGSAGAPQLDTAQAAKLTGTFIFGLIFLGVWALFELGAWAVKRRLLEKHPKLKRADTSGSGAARR